MCALLSSFLLTPFHRYRPVGGARIRLKISEEEKWYNTILTNHNNDPTGVHGEERVVWFDDMTHYKQWTDDHAPRNQAQQNHRQNMREVQEELGAVQAPLGPGNPPLRSEVAAQNPPQVRGPQELAANMEVIEVNEVEPPARATASRQGNIRRRSISPVPGTGTRSNRRRTDGATIQDQINEGRQNLNTIVGTIEGIAQTFAPQQVQESNPFKDHPVSSLQAMQQNMLTVASNLGQDHVQTASNRLFQSWMGLVDNHARANNIQRPVDADSAVAAAASAEEEDDDVGYLAPYDDED